MGKIQIVTTPDPRLRRVAEKVKTIDTEVQTAIAELRQACRDWEKAHPHEISAAIAAPQLGYNLRVILVREDFEASSESGSEADYIALINPEIIKTEGKIVRDYEGCLSVPEIYALVPRPKKAKVRATLEDGKEVKIKADGFLARTLLHEIDHLNGILFIDHVKTSRKAFYHLDADGELRPLDYDTKIKGNRQLWGDDE